MATKRHYVNNRDFYEAIISYREKLKEDPSARIPEYIGVCIFKICERLSTKPNFVGYSFRDEMVSDGIENCIRSVHLFDPARTNNPFAYFTQIAWNAFIRRIGSEKKEQYVKHKNMINGMLNSELDDESFSTIAGSKSTNNEITNNIIEDFEKKLTKGKKQDKVFGVEKFMES
jgi:hypothetical protein